MKACAGDWIVIENPPNGSRPRRGRIVEVHGEDGEAPYIVRWNDDHRRDALVYPGEDATLYTPKEMAEYDERLARERLPLGRLRTTARAS